MPRPTPADPRLTPRTLLALAAMAVGVFVITNDFTALSVAIPQIESDLHTSLNRAQWVINGYSLVFGVLLVTGGRVADLFGRKRAFIAGAVSFGTCSLLAGLMPGVGLLIAFRALMGVGAALMWPAVLGLVYTILPASRKGLAGGLVLGVAGLGNAAGPLLGGWLTDAVTWRLVFFVNVPVTAFAILATLREVPESRVTGATRKLDYPGIGLLSGGTVALLLALDLGTGSGFSAPGIIALFAAGAAALAAFFAVERRQGPAALVPPAVLANRTFAAACLTVLLISAIFFAALLYLPQFLEVVLGFSALRSGAGLLPMMGAFALASFAAGSVYSRLGPRVTVSAGTALLAGGIFWLSFLGAGSDYPSLVPGMVVLGTGVGVYYSSVTTASVTALGPSRASLAGGIVYMCEIAGGAIGLGLNTAIVLSAATLAGGIRVAFRVDAALGAAGVAVALAFLRGPRGPVTGPPSGLERHRAPARN